MKPAKPEAVMRKLKKLFDDSGLSLEQLGKQMGYEEGTARRAAWQFLNKTSDPRLSMLQRFAGAVGVDLKEIV
jgi:transcriptional regulator with XRE-family HTH domain